MHRRIDGVEDATKVPLMTAAQASPDLLLASIFVWCARTAPADRATRLCGLHPGGDDVGEQRPA